MEIKLYSLYPHFTDPHPPKYIKWITDDSIDTKIEAYWDLFLPLAAQNKNNGKKKIAIITEPSCIWNNAYNYNIADYLKNNYNLFEYIFTYDDEILKLPNAKKAPFFGTWDTNDIPKTKDISMCCSNKSMCKGHLLRKAVADKLKNKVDVLGNYLGSRRVSTKEIYAEYKYSVVMENQISNWFITEKVLNAFSNKCIPIYYGSPKILEIFNPEGIIYVEDINKIEKIINKLDVNDYNKHLKAIEDNFEKVKNYSCYEDWIYLTYRKELEELWKS